MKEVRPNTSLRTGIKNYVHIQKRIRIITDGHKNLNTLTDVNLPNSVYSSESAIEASHLREYVLRLAVKFIGGAVKVSVRGSAMC